ncbi:cation:dicarboxylase symporter family transporter [Sneathiella sp. P13V-1]|uniref:dicarboxylate/amino acid:cation symporter n=1 Tax=Sneathiella sp. P13V-1 TaxID=2697366 RepID=UPI00187B19EB|nr:dicarboxylate/amino acid:cation symporter [Sneathiella sp. P13V-1]MBE7636178.1 cation:dicarboxylase symporter family transporter [Sneathiella sp. P13V-1]
MENLLSRSLKGLTYQFDRLIKSKLWLKVVIALVLGILSGILLGPDLGLIDSKTVLTITSWLALPGQVFLSVIQMIVVPLVVASVVRGLAANNNPAAIKKNGLLAITFIFVSTAIAASIGIILGLNIQPGSFIDASALIDMSAVSSSKEVAGGFPPLAELPDKVSSLIPRNPIASMVSGEMLQIILFAAVLGAAMLSIPAHQSKPLFDVLAALQEVCLRIVSWAMVLAPLAVFGLITKLVASVGLEVLAGMAIYVVTVIAGLLMIAVLYIIIVRLTLDQPVKEFFNNIKELLLLAFSTSSSAAVMPITLKVVEDKLNIRTDISRFLIPLGATINMAGTALYQGVATVFLAQVFNVDLSISSYLFVVTMAVAASVGSPATPGAGIVILSIVLEGVGIPSAGIALILGVDRILDMFRTSINVLGDVTACTVVKFLTTKKNDQHLELKTQVIQPQPED